MGHVDKIIDKNKVIQSFIDHFSAEYQALVKSAKAAHEAATHEESKSEDKHDTRAIEASYLAHGQAMRVAEIENVIEELKHYLGRKPATRIQPGALIQLETAGKKNWIFF